LSAVLLVLNVAAYGILWAVNILRIRWFTELVIGDLKPLPTEPLQAAR
jgi:hypothetical protein